MGLVTKAAVDEPGAPGLRGAARIRLSGALRPPIVLCRMGGGLTDQLIRTLDTVLSHPVTMLAA